MYEIRKMPLCKNGSREMSLDGFKFCAESARYCCNYSTLTPPKKRNPVILR